MMKQKYDMTFYGTSAAEAIPNPFCDCYLCRYARDHGGKDVRTRSMFRINEAVMIDMGADSLVQANTHGDFLRLSHVLITHTHEDHLAHMMFNVRSMATDRRVDTLHFYLVDKAFDMIEFYRKSEPIIKGKLSLLEEEGVVAFHRQEFHKPFMADGMEVTALRGNHKGNMKEDCANYLIKLHNGKMLYYGVDSGMYLPETFEALKGVKLDYLISECSYGNGEDYGENPGHLCHRTCMEIFKKLYEQHTLEKDSRIYLTHINHCHTADHESLQRLFDSSDFPIPCRVAWDGMELLQD